MLTGVGLLDTHLSNSLFFNLSISNIAGGDIIISTRRAGTTV